MKLDCGNSVGEWECFLRVCCIEVDVVVGCDYYLKVGVGGDVVLDDEGIGFFGLFWFDCEVIGSCFVDGEVLVVEWWVDVVLYEDVDVGFDDGDVFIGEGDVLLFGVDVVWGSWFGCWGDEGLVVEVLVVGFDWCVEYVLGVVVFEFVG